MKAGPRPGVVIAAYSERCRATGLKITEDTTHEAGNHSDAAEARLVCEIEPYIDAEFLAERESQAT